MQANICPQWFQDELTRIGGTNPYGEPNFRVVWGTYSFRWSGGYWEGWGTGYRHLPESGDHWILQMWEPAQVFGYPAVYYRDNRDDMTGLSITGPFPYSGRYITLQSFTHNEVVNGRLIRIKVPLTSDILTRIVPIIMDAKHHSAAKRKAAIEAIKERKKKAQVEEIKETLRSGAPAFGGEAVSFRGQGCKTSLLTKKMDQIEAVWKREMKNGAYRHNKRGVQQHRKIQQLVK